MLLHRPLIDYKRQICIAPRPFSYATTRRAVEVNRRPATITAPCILSGNKSRQPTLNRDLTLERLPLAEIQQQATGDAGFVERAAFPFRSVQSLGLDSTYLPAGGQSPTRNIPLLLRR